MKHKDLSQTITGNIAWNFVGQGWLLILTFFTMPFIIHRLGVHLYGIFVLISVVIDYFAFLQFGMGTAAIKYIARYMGQKDIVKIRTTFWTGVISHSVIGVLGTMILFVLAPALIERFFNVPADLKETAVFSLRVGSLGFLLSMLSGMTSGVIRASGRFDIINMMGIVFSTLQISATIVLLLMGLSLEEIVIANVIVQFLGLCGYWVYSNRLFPYLKKFAWNAGILFRLVKFGGFVTISAVVGPILTNVEKIFLTSLRSLSALTYYSVPFSLINRLSVIPSSFSQVLFPVFSFYQGADQENSNRDLHYRSTLYVFMLYAMPLAFLFFFGASFLSWWIGNSFAEESTLVLIILGMGGLINALAYPSVTALQGMGKPHLAAAFHVIETVVYVPACYFLIKAYGGIGAATAWLLRVSLDTLLLQIASCRMLAAPLGQWYRNLLYRGVPPLLLILLLFGGLKSLNLELFHPFNIAGILGILSIHSGVVWIWVLDASTRTRMKRFLVRP